MGDRPRVGTVADYFRESFDATARNLREKEILRRKGGGISVVNMDNRLAQAWSVGRTREGTLLVTRIQGTVDSLTSRAGRSQLFSFEVDLKRGGVRAASPAAMTEFTGNAYGRAPWQVISAKTSERSATAGSEEHVAHDAVLSAWKAGDYETAYRAGIVFIRKYPSSNDLGATKALVNSAAMRLRSTAGRGQRAAPIAVGGTPASP
jgi:hypothetical protein